MLGLKDDHLQYGSHAQISGYVVIQSFTSLLGTYHLLAAGWCKSMSLLTRVAKT